MAKSKLPVVLNRAQVVQAIEVARRQYNEHARAMRVCAKAGGNALITPQAAELLAIEYASKVGQCSEMLGTLAEHPGEIQIAPLGE
jgi:hypothetical protein